MSRSTAAPLTPISELPGPVGDRWSGNLSAYEGDRLGFLLRCRAEFGSLVRFDDRTSIVNDASLAAEVLMDRNQTFAIRENFRGETLGPVEIMETRRLRPALNPGMRRAKAGAIARSVARLWKPKLATVQGSRVDPLPILEEVCAQSTADFYFGADAEGLTGSVRDLLAVLDGYFNNPLSLPQSWPSPRRRRVRQRHSRLEAKLLPLLKARSQATDEQDHDLSASLVRSLSVDADVPLKRIAQMIIGSLLAAQRVPAAAGAWMLWEVGRREELQERLRPEADRYTSTLLSGPPLAITDCPLALAVVLETLRLHPPTWVVHRSLLHDAAIGDYSAPSGHNLLISPYVLHRDESYFADAVEFRLDRWEATRGTPAGYFPFGRGPHGCPGKELALAMLVSILMTSIASTRVKPTISNVVPNPRSTLLPSGLELIFLRR